MAIAEPGSALVEQVLSGGSRELRLLAARGMLPLPPEELIPIQVKLARDDDPEVAGRATAVLRATEPRVTAEFLATDAGAEEMAYFAAEVDHLEVVEALIRRRDVPRPVLVELAPRLDPRLQEVLILRQDAIVEEPAILTGLERNPELAPYVKRRIAEYRQHLLQRKKAEPGEAAEEELEEPDEEEVAAAIVKASEEEPSGELDETTGLTEGQIRTLPVPVRMKLSRGASRTLRSILVRDSNSIVALSVLQNNAMSEDEVEQIARNRSIIDDVLEEIARHRDWMSKYGIVHALVTNPRTNVGTAVRLVPRLGVRDLRSLSFNRNVPDAVRAAAQRLYQVKTR